MRYIFNVFCLYIFSFFCSLWLHFCNRPTGQPKTATIVQIYMLAHSFLPISVKILIFVQRALTLILSSTVRSTKVTCLAIDIHAYPCRTMNRLMISEPTLQQDFLIDYLILFAFVSEACSILYNITYCISNLHRTPDLFFATYFVLCLWFKLDQFIHTCRI